MLIKLIYVVVILLFSVYITNAQLSVNRAGFPILIHHNLDSNKYIESTNRFSFNVQRGFGSTKEQYYINGIMEGLIELYRWDMSVLAIMVSNEVTIDPFNDIKFNPKGTTWQETLFYTYGTNMLNYTVGFTHRSRHEVDNYDTDRKDITSIEDLTKRVPLTSGPFLGISKIYDFNNFIFSSLFDYYYAINSGDWRDPINEYPISFATFNGELNNLIVLEHKTFKKVNLYSRIWNNFMFFEKGITKYNGKIELGTKFSVSKSKVSIYMAYETFFDDFTNVKPQSSEFFNIGVRLSDSMIW